ncbi:MAG: hypothetical protein WBP42_11515 [Candidatus Zixiibacteriota bacterium]
MNIVIPIRLVQSRTRGPIARAQIYNLDDNEYFNFQFNPQTLEPGRDYGWSDEGWTGSDKYDTQFLGVGQTELELASDWLVDPAAPIIRYHIDRTLMYQAGPNPTQQVSLVKVEEIIKTLENWGAIRERERRSSLVRVIIGDNWYYNGRMTRFSCRIDERFADGTIRRAAIRIGFKEWRSTRSFAGGLTRLART